MTENALYPISEAEDLVQNFLSLQLKKGEFTHEAHLLSGLYILAHHGDDAMGILRQKIADYLASIGVENTDTSGYHEALTRFWLWALENELSDESGQIHWNQDTVDELISSEKLTERNLWLAYYSKEKMMSVEARRGYVEPDLKKNEWLKWLNG